MCMLRRRSCDGQAVLVTSSTPGLSSLLHAVVSHCNGWLCFQQTLCAATWSVDKLLLPIFLRLSE